MSADDLTQEERAMLDAVVGLSTAAKLQTAVAICQARHQQAWNHAVATGRMELEPTPWRCGQGPGCPVCWPETTVLGGIQARTVELQARSVMIGHVVWDNRWLHVADIQTLADGRLRFTAADSSTSDWPEDAHVLVRADGGQG